MAYISAPHAPDGERWFHRIDRDAKTEGIWHLGGVPHGKTWPVAKARCGYAQPDIKIGWHVTAASISTREENFCATCLASLQSQLDQERGR